MYVLHWFLKYPHLSRVVSCLCLWRIQSLKGTKWVQNPFQKPIYYKQELTQGLQLCVSQVQSLSRVRLFVTPWTAARQASLSITNSWSLLKLMSIESVMASIRLILCRPLLLLPSVFPSIRIFSNESVLRIMWPNYWSFCIIPSKEYSEMIFFRMDCLDLLAVQGTLNSLLQHHSSKASVLLTFLYSPTLTSIHNYWKNHSLD